MSVRKLIITVLCLLVLCLPVSAANQADSIQLHTTVTSDGSCQVTVLAQLRVDTPDSSLAFPLPANAENITVNGTSVRPSLSGGFRQVNLNKIMGTGPWQSTVTFQYSLPQTVFIQENGTLLLQLPLLCGYAYPVDTLHLNINLPGNVEESPAFTSGYFRRGIESDMVTTVSGGQITSFTLTRLLDRETLTMELPVKQEMFPTVVAPETYHSIFPLLMLVCMGLSLVYWLLFLRCKPLWGTRRTMPPEGLTAGEVGSRLIGAGADLSLMVVCWAELGYLYLDRDDAGRVLLHKRMDMGSERSAFENRCFRLLFRNKQIVDGTGYHYARLCHKIRTEKANLKGQYLPKSGNPKLMRWLSCAAGFCALASAGETLGTTLPLRLLWAGVFGAAGALTAWFIQDGAQSIHLRDKLPGLLALVCAGVWLGAAAWLNAWATVGGALFFQLLTGLAATYGGRRTDAARQTARELLGLRRYMCHVSRQELVQIVRNNPDYYYHLAPYALALGVDKRFAKRFGRSRQIGCSYLTTGVGPSTAYSWYPLLRDAVNTLDARQKRMRWERHS